MTLSGKTVLARKIAAAYQRRGVGILVHDKFHSDWGQHRTPARVFVTDDDALFLRWAREARRCALFIDEAPDLCRNDKRGDAFAWLATQGRHWGHRCHFIGQGPLSVGHQIRANCTELFSFRLKAGEAKKLYAETGESWSLATKDLRQGEFYQSAPFESVRLRRVF